VIGGRFLVRSILRTAFGGPEVLVIREIPEPSASDGERRPPDLLRQLRVRKAGFSLSDVPLQAIAADVEAGRCRAKPTRVFRFEDIQEPHRVMESNEAKGKRVVLR
jgi:NADPH:quinone reductase-like Zn-dependent oxidoreductase